LGLLASTNVGLALEAGVGVLGVLGALLAVDDGLDALVEGVQFGVERIPLGLLLAAEGPVLVG
jgi:hypothetical protein